MRKLTVKEFLESDEVLYVCVPTKALNELLYKEFNKYVHFEPIQRLKGVIMSAWDVYKENTCYLNTPNGYAHKLCNKLGYIEQVELILEEIDITKLPKLSKEDLSKYLVANYITENGILDLSGLDFSKLCNSVDISQMKVKFNLYQNKQEVGWDLFQDHQKVDMNLNQNYQKVTKTLNQDFQEVGFYLFQSNQKVGSDLYQSQQEVRGSLFQVRQKVACNLWQNYQEVEGEKIG